MQYTEIMVRYGELSTKGKNRRSFIMRLAQNVRGALAEFPDLKIHADRDRMHILLKKRFLGFKPSRQVFA